MPTDGTYSLDGYSFGTVDHDAVILSGGYDPGTATVRSQDADNPVGDGVLLGRDYFSGPTITFTLGVRNLDNITSVWETVSTLAKAWRADSVRNTPGATSTLKFTRAGVTYQVKGRARNFAVQPADTADDEWTQVEATFDCVSPSAEVVSSGDGGNESLKLTLLAKASDGGLILPAIVPFELRPTSQGQYGSVDVGGVFPTTFKITLKGPVTGSLTNAVVKGTGWEVGITTPIAYDQSVVIDMAAQTVKRNGVSIPGSVTRNTRLNARLSPGVQTISFNGSDPSNTATMTLLWNSSVPL